jgi:hypothetical protein
MELIIYACILLMMFFLSGIGKLKSFDSKVDFLKSRLDKIGIFNNLPRLFYQLTMLISALLLIVCPLIIIDSLYYETYNIYSYFCCLILVGFTILATLVVHFPPFGKTYYAFIGNVTTCGGLLLLSHIIKNKNSCIRNSSLVFLLNM